MKLDNFKELLAKKADGRPNLQLLIKYMQDDYLVDHVVESLEKMASNYTNKAPNDAVLMFGRSAARNPHKAEMFRDALSHHASQYKAALNAGNEKVADSHMKKIFKMIHMAQKLGADGLEDHSNGTLKVEAIDPKPWERQGYLSQNDNGRFKNATRGWDRHVNNYSWLRGAPHESYAAETEAHGHKGAYPLEEIKVGGKYIHIDDDAEFDGKHIDHPLDNHPIFRNYKTPTDQFDGDDMRKYLEDRKAFHSDESGNIDKYWDRVDSRDPEKHALRGSEKSKAVHKPLLSGDDALKRLSEITGKKSEASAAPKAEETPSVKVEKQPAADKGLGYDESMAQLKRIMQGKKPKG